MIQFFVGFLTCLSAFFRSRYNLGIEILALRQQLCVLKRKHPRPRLRIQDRIFWVLLRRLWPAWSNILVIVKPETVVAWHRAGFSVVGTPPELLIGFQSRSIPGDPAAAGPDKAGSDEAGVSVPFDSGRSCR